jgi:hypothetical protein
MPEVEAMLAESKASMPEVLPSLTVFLKLKPQRSRRDTEKEAVRSIVTKSTGNLFSQAE